MPEQVDVLICGSGSAGLCAAVWLARCGVDFKILEQRDGPLQQGQADGVQVRTVEILESLGLSEDLLKEACHVLELTFWTSSGDEGIRRSRRMPDTDMGLSHLPHVILNQARINELMIRDIERSCGNTNIRYGSRVTDVKVDGQTARDPRAHCVTVKTVENGTEHVYRAKYVLGCDGAHSAVRKSLGFNMVGDSTDAVWAVMDVYPVTDFPDIRKKSVLQTDAGNLVVIPREGEEKVRFYMEMPPGWAAAAAAADVTPDNPHLKARLERIFHPYEVAVAETAWFSVYAIGQRLADRFTQDYRVFLTGDACHTHSPKAGQGMNVSLQDGYNIGWKLAAVLCGQARPALLETYVTERQETAKDLIEFDRYFTKLFSSAYRKEHRVSSADFQDYFVKMGRYTAGLAIQYKPSLTVQPGEEDGLAAGVPVGMRFPSAQVVRLFDVRTLQLAKALVSDSRWHMIVFGGDVNDEEARTRLFTVTDNLNEALSKLPLFNRRVHDFIHPILVLKSDRLLLDEKNIPPFYTPKTGRGGVRCHLNVFLDDQTYHDGHGEAYKKYGVDRKVGAMVLVRPDQYVARIFALEDPVGVWRFFEAYLSPTPNGMTSA
ncbi:FAD-dependent monooxygenase terD [Colletotrichum spinosum]|uniref:FAD-dependent monooxygenase terD n=1 Tax=Colletotrichum spinosum TaxID=1347390 RepID=A0A4V3HQS4_9PEZI|nr:FAD-dependent monooxygenase terD [Colletotrichum spinosum]